MTELELLQADMHLAKLSKDNALIDLKVTLHKVMEWRVDHNKWLLALSHEAVTKCILVDRMADAKKLADSIGAYQAKRGRYNAALSEYRAKKASK